jgi:pantoate--beta-alanine ligase
LQIVKTIAELRRAVSTAKEERKSIGFVPTMGALHEGHLSLIKESKEQNDFTVVSIFVNPTQFGPNEDLTRYPRPFEADAAKCEITGVDLIFAPSIEEVYPEGFSTFVDVGGITEVLEGASRPGHFRGVTTIVLKLFTAVEPTRAYFGMKDYQQLKVIQKMVHDLNLNVEIVPVPTFRESDGLAMSSRNEYLDPGQRKAALVLYRALIAAREAIQKGEKNVESVRQVAMTPINVEPLASVDYIAVVDPETLQPMKKIAGQTLVVLAVRIGSTRLIDNMLIGGNE